MWYSYSEAISFLYSSYTFDFRYHHTVFPFFATAPQHRLHQISSLQFTCDFWNPNLMEVKPRFFPKDQQRSASIEDICELLASLRGLKVLRIEHICRDPNKYRDLYESADGAKKVTLQAMCLIQQTKIFEVRCPWSVEEIKKELGDMMMTFQLVE